MSSLPYRSDIDGLRAIAVLAVLLYHADLGISGGYVGVDVFFVISGYLITGLIKRDLERGTFSLANFWVRRIRRILPASVVTASATLAVGVFLLLPSDLKKTAWSAVAQQALLANVYFYRNTFYFDPTNMRPLLHMWSLAVEEQFYLGFPIFLTVLYRKAREPSILVVLATVAALSFAMGQHMMALNPKGAFFLLPGRMWELLAGSMLVYVPRPTNWPRTVRQVSAGVGLAAILACCLLYDQATRFPGSAALLPTLGAALLIYANSEHDTLAHRVLSQRSLTFVGLISYSLYLVHWPVLAYLHYSEGEALPLELRLATIPLVFLLAYASYRFVETPFRKGFPDISLRRTFAVALGAVGVVAGGALVLILAQGLPGRLSPRVAKVLATARIDSTLNGRPVPELPTLPRSHKVAKLGIDSAGIDFMLWGDSHAHAVAGLVDQLARERQLSGVLAFYQGFPPLLGIWEPAHGDEDAEFEKVIAFAREKQIRHLILVSVWSLYTEGRLNGATDRLIVDDPSKAVNRANARAAFSASLERTVRELRRSVDTVWIMAEVPTQFANPPLAVVRSISRDEGVPDGISMERHRRRTAFVKSTMQAVASRVPNVFVVDLAEFCHDADVSRIGSDSAIYYFDAHHLSKAGVHALLKAAFEPILDRAATATAFQALPAARTWVAP